VNPLLKNAIAGARAIPRDVWVVAAVVTAVVVAISIAVVDTPRANESLQHLGAEYFNIARAIVDGRGFSDPFAEHTGPTAWMPPLYPLLLAGILAVVKTRAWTATVIVLARDVCHVVTGLAIYDLAKRRGLRLSPWLAVALYVVWLVAFVDWMFYLTHDVWLLGVGVLVVLVALDRFDADGRVHPLGWGIGGGIFLLASPILGVAAAIAIAVALFVARAGWRQWGLTFALAAVILLPWVVRNRVVFHEYVPTKSNLYFDLYQANFDDDDGIWDQTSMSHHPYISSAERFAYSRQGEIAYVAGRRTLFWKAIRAHFPVYAKKVRNRVLAETLVYSPVLEHDRGFRLVVTRIVYALPFLGLLFGLALPSPHRRFLMGCAIFMTAYLSVYALVGFFIRYILPLTPLLLASCFFGFDALAGRLSRWPIARRARLARTTRSRGSR
jgi:hypothetical protein